MGWMRTLLLGDIGNRLDIEDAEREIHSVRRSLSIAQMEQGAREREVTLLKEEVAQMKLATQALTRFLIEKGVVNEAELEAFIVEVDGEDGVVDGKMSLDLEGRRLRLQFAERPSQEH